MMVVPHYSPAIVTTFLFVFLSSFLLCNVSPVHSFSLPQLPLLPPWRGLRQLLHIGHVGYWFDRMKYQHYRTNEVLYLTISPTTNNDNNDDGNQPKLVTNLPPKSPSSVRIIFISDTHGKHVCLSNRIPKSSSIDIMIHCGDVTLSYGYPKDNYKQQARVWNNFDSWLGRMRVEKGISEMFVLFGNHDSLGEKDDNNEKPLLQNAKLIHDGTFIQTRNGNLRIFGSSFSPPGVTCNNAFQNVQMLKEHLYKAEEQKLDILITHGPSQEMQQLAESTNAHIWVYGHFHDGYGINTVKKKTENESILYTINAASCDMIYRPVNPPIIVDYTRFNDE